LESASYFFVTANDGVEFGFFGEGCEIDAVLGESFAGFIRWSLGKDVAEIGTVGWGLGEASFGRMVQPIRGIVSVGTRNGGWTPHQRDVVIGSIPYIRRRKYGNRTLGDI
jgi:hypothetical protein